METIKKIDMSSVMLGFTIVGDAFHDTAGDKIGFFLGGLYDFEVKLAIYYKEHSKLPASESELETDLKTKEAFFRMKHFFKMAVMNAMNEELRLERKKAQILFEERARQVRENFKQMHSQAPEGTVKELASRYNKTISEIRRLKAEGRLHELKEGA